jgi:hypothetical protein
VEKPRAPVMAVEFRLKEVPACQGCSTPSTVGSSVPTPIRQFLTLVARWNLSTSDARVLLGTRYSTDQIEQMRSDPRSLVLDSPTLKRIWHLAAIAKDLRRLYPLSFADAWMSSPITREQTPLDLIRLGGAWAISNFAHRLRVRRRAAPRASGTGFIRRGSRDQPLQ